MCATQKNWIYVKIIQIMLSHSKSDSVAVSVVAVRNRLRPLQVSPTPRLTALPSLCCCSHCLSLSLHVVLYFGFSWPPTSHLYTLSLTHTHRQKLCWWSCVNQGSRSNATSAFLNSKAAFV